MHRNITMVLMVYIGQVQSYLASYASAVMSHEVAESVSFTDFCDALNHLPEDYLFLAPFVGKFPTGDIVVQEPVSADPGPCTMHYDVDSAHLVGTSIPIVGPLSLFTVVNYDFTINNKLHYKFSVQGFQRPVELKKIPNFRVGEFGFGGRWKVG